MELLKVIPETGLSKQKISASAKDIIRQIEDGNLDPIKALIAFKAVEKLGEEILDYIKTKCQGEAEKYKGSAFFGANISVRATPASYNLEADEEYAQLKAKMKEREAYLKEAIKSKSGRVLTEEGEVVEAPPMVKPQGSTIVVSFKNQ